jgi:CubicO group peptidase (beta-lactamase class C family)
MQRAIVAILRERVHGAHGTAHGTADRSADRRPDNCAPMNRSKTTTLLPLRALRWSLAALALLALLATLAFAARDIVPPWMAIQGKALISDFRHFDAMPITRAAVPSPLPVRPAALAWPAAAGSAPEAWLADKGTVALIVLRRGELVYEGYFDGFTRGSVGTSFSVAKSIVSALVGIALAEGRIGSLDDPLTRHLPELGRADARFARITLRHLLLMRSGIAFDEGYRSPLSDASRFYLSRDLAARVRALKIAGEPDRQQAYKSGDTQLLGLVLERATGMPLARYAESRLWQPMGAAFDTSWSLDSAGSGMAKAFCCVNARALDFARFGQLFLEGGRVGGRQVVPEAWVRESTAVAERSGSNDTQRRNIERAHSERRAFYAYQWRRAALANGEPAADFYAQGLLGQYVYVAPQTRTVLVRLGRRQGDVFWPAFLGDLARLNP